MSVGHASFFARADAKAAAGVRFDDDRFAVAWAAGLAVCRRLKQPANKRPVRGRDRPFWKNCFRPPTYFFAGSPVFGILSFFIMSAHMASFFIIASSFVVPSFFAMAM